MLAMASTGVGRASGNDEKLYKVGVLVDGEEKFEQTLHGVPVMEPFFAIVTSRWKIFSTVFTLSSSMPPEKVGPMPRGKNQYLREVGDGIHCVHEPLEYLHELPEHLAW